MYSAKIFIVVFVFVVVLAASARPQEFLLLSDEDIIELQIDNLRKGIQQEDTSKLAAVFAAQVTIEKTGNYSATALGKEFQKIFDRATSREICLPTPAVTKSKNPLNGSHFWDFDILEPKISILDDSAIVKCQLILWGTQETTGTNKPEKRIREQMVFVGLKTDEREPNPQGYIAWPKDPHNEIVSHPNRVWRLMKCDYLLDFLAHSGVDTDKIDSSIGGMQ